MSTESPSLGKFDRDRLYRRVFAHLDEDDRDRFQLEYGSDYNVVELDERNVLVVSADPLAISPQLGWRRAAELALQVVTTDVAVSGISPEWLVVSWNLPPDLSDSDFETIWAGFTAEARKLGTKIVGGHTGRYESQKFPMVGAGTVFGVGSGADLLPQTFRPGDKVYLLNKLGVEAAGIFSFYHPDKLAAELSAQTVSAARSQFDRLAPTQNLLKLASMPEVKALHDVAEGGFIGGLQELLAGKQVGAAVRPRELQINDVVSRVCRRLDLDPLKITSIGSAIAVVSRRHEDRFRQAGCFEELSLQVVGRITGRAHVELQTENGTEVLSEPVYDRFWERLSEYGD